MAKVMSPGNNYEVEITVKNRNSDTRLLEPTEGLSITCDLVATEGATTALSGVSQLTLTEAAGKPGTYYASFPGAQLTSGALGTAVEVWLYLLASTTLQRWVPVPVDLTGNVEILLD